MNEEFRSRLSWDPLVSSKSTIVAPFEYLLERYIEFLVSFADLFKLDLRCEPDLDIDFYLAQNEAPLPPPQPLFMLLSKSPDPEATLEENAKLWSAFGLALLLVVVLLRLNDDLPDLPETPLLLNFD